MTTMAEEIPLTQGKIAIVDDDDYERLIKVRWYANKIHNIYYACRHESPQIVQLMHREIMNFPKNKFIDHINGNGLDNRKVNLRIVTNRENLQNYHVNKSSKYPGVSYITSNKKWRAHIRINKVLRSLGEFNHELDAATTYRVACAVLINGL